MDWKAVSRYLSSMLLIFGFIALQFGLAALLIPVVGINFAFGIVVAVVVAVGAIIAGATGGR